MPNHCQNRLIVEGPAVEVERFRQQAAEGAYADGQPMVFSVENFVPIPPEGDPRRRPDDSCEGGWDWHTWRCDNWGCKWDVYAVKLNERAAERLVYRFESAWAPPIEGVRRISFAFPTLTLDLVYMEAGMQFYGRSRFVDGGTVEEEQREYDAIEYDDDGEVVAINDPILKAHVETHDFGFSA